jgi:acetyl esterase/lipase
MTGRKIDLEAEIDATHKEILDMFPKDLLRLDDIPALRAAIKSEPVDFPENVLVEDVMIPGLNNDPDVKVRLYKPIGLAKESPCLIWMHPGGMTIGDANMEDLTSAQRAVDHSCLVASVDYRLAPENPYPSAPDDCYAALLWFANNTSELGISSSRIAIGGASAGAGLAASTSLRARDESGPEIVFQLLTYPMLDHRNTNPSSYGVMDDFRVWNRKANLISWEAYLGDLTDIPTYASPSLEVNLSNLPPTMISVGALDNFVDECIDFAQRLMQAGVRTDLRVYGGAFHGSVGFVSHSPISIEWAKAENDALHRALYPNS